MRVAVILSGCGVFDGSEIHETTLTLLHCAKNNLAVSCFAPDSDFQPIDHRTQQPMPSSRNILGEAARLARGHIQSLNELRVSDYHGLLFPGGFGAATQLSDFAQTTQDWTVDPAIKQLILTAHAQHIAMGFLCIAPVLAAGVLPHLTLTLGQESDMTERLQQKGHTLITCEATDFISDQTHRILSTPAYLATEDLTQIDRGIGQMILAFARLLQQPLREIT